MRYIALLFFFVFFLVRGYAQNDTGHSIDQLEQIIRSGDQADAQKQNAILSLKQQLNSVALNDDTRLFKIYKSLYESYKLFQYDSAYVYVRKLQEVSGRLQDPVLINYSRIQLGFILLSSGMYKETFDTLSFVNLAAVPDSNKAEYYALLGRYYYDLADYDNDRYHTPEYNKTGGRYIDSALSIWDQNQYEYLYYEGLKKLRLGNRMEAKINFSTLLSRPNLTPHQIAVTASTLADLYIQQLDNDSAIQLLTKAVIADVRSSTKETSAAFILSTLLYKKGDIKNASLCINRAFSDAVFYGARQRKVQVSAILPLIEAQKLAIVESQRTRLLWYALLVTLLLLAVIILIFVVYRQVKKLKEAQKTILEAHQKTQEVNKRLSETNEKLNDANKIKEEYIGYFFNVNSEFFDKIERFKKSVEQKIADRKIDEIKFLVNNINLKREKEEMIRHFDRAFLRLFPNFVAEFNELFKPEDRMELSENELLNTDLRIFALIRMGIHEPEKIAHILQYSVNTINTYKTKIKNKSIVPNEEFERRIMQIRTVQ